MFQRLHDVFATIAKPWINGRREARKRAHDCQHTYLLPVDRLVVDKIHSPSLIALRRFNPILTQLRFNAPFWRLVPQLKAHLIVKAVNPLGIHLPSLTSEQQMDVRVPIAHPRFCDLLDTFLELGLFIPMSAVLVGRTMRLQHTTDTPDADTPNRAQLTHPLPAASRP